MPTRRPVNEPGPGGDGEQIDGVRAPTPRRDHELDQLARQPLAVRERRVAGHLGQHDCAVGRWRRCRRARWCRGRAQSSEESQWAQCYTRDATLRQHFVPHLMTSPAFSEPAGATPAMRQYLDAKRQHRDAIVFFRMGDFYEMFYEDALTAARALELTLTSRSKDASGGAIPMCGVPYHAADGYIARLVRKGFRVAICEQVEDPRKAKGLVRREVVRVVSPGTLTDAGYLDAREPAFLMAIAPAIDAPRTRRGAARPVDRRVHDRRVSRRRRRARRSPTSWRCCGRARCCCPIGVDDAVARCSASCDLAGARHAGRRLGLRARGGAARAARSAARRTASTASASRPTRPRCAPPARSCTTCARRRRPTSRTSATIAYRAGADCLLDRSDDAAASRGDRVGRAADARGIAAGRDRSHGHVDGRPAAARVAAAAAAVARADPGSARRRRGVRVPHDRARQGPRDAARRPRHRAAGRARRARHRRAARSRLARASRSPPSRACSCCSSELQAPLVSSLVAELDDLADVREAARGDAARRAAGVRARRRRRFATASIPSSTSCATISRSGKQRIAEMEDAERARTGIASLKIRYNRVFGYYIEISKSNLAPCRPTTTASRRSPAASASSRPALKEYEEKVLGADERILERELEIFEALRTQVAAEAPRIQDTARALAALDVLGALAETAAALQLHQADDARRRRARSRPTRAIRSSSGTSRTRSCRTTSRSTAPTTSSSSSPARTWAASRPTCGRRRCSA